jgi:hypothetical protein
MDSPAFFPSKNKSLKISLSLSISIYTHTQERSTYQHKLANQRRALEEHFSDRFSRYRWISLDPDSFAVRQHSMRFAQYLFWWLVLWHCAAALNRRDGREENCCSLLPAHRPAVGPAAAGVCQCRVQVLRMLQVVLHWLQDAPPQVAVRT